MFARASERLDNDTCWRVGELSGSLRRMPGIPWNFVRRQSRMMIDETHENGRYVAYLPGIFPPTDAETFQ